MAPSSKNPLTKVRDKLIQLRREAEERDAQRKASKTGYPYTNLTTTPINTEALALIPQEIAQKAEIAAIEIKEKNVAVAALDPKSSSAQEVIQKLKADGYQPSIFVVSLSGLHHIWSFYKFVAGKTAKITGRITIEEEKLATLKKTLTSLENIETAIQKLNSGAGFAGEILEVTLAGALATKASDIHFEPAENHVKLRLRIDGLLHDASNDLKNAIYEHLVSRMKILAGLKINVKDEPQDGRFTITLPDKEIEIRASINPSEFGETIVLRILDPDTIKLSLLDLGFREDDLKIMQRELERPNGMILNTGPTGSGKTTTLYTFLRHTHKPEIKTITIEDPIEYHLEGVEQTQVDPEAGYTFAKGLRSLLRQDPDMILVGEIRDLETAEIAIHAALTGHLVFSTLHTNDSFGAIPRLVDMGVKLSVIAPSMNVIIAQRLVRRLCQNCRQPEEIDTDLKNKIEKFLTKMPERINKNQYFENGKLNVKTFKAKGCEKCSGFGYKGRVGVFELLQINEDLERLIIDRAVEAEIKDLAFKKGFVTMQQDGVLKALVGQTTFDEVERNTGPIEW